MFPSFEIFGAKIFNYPLLMGAAWGLAIQIAKIVNARRTEPLKHLNLFLTGVFVASWAGAKTFYLLTADFIGKQEVAGSANFWLGGGFVFYGGLVFGLGFTMLFALKTKQSIFKFNPLVPALAIGHAVGRVGCFLAGCCYGKHSEAFFSVHMHGLNRYPTQLMEAGALLIFGLLAMRPTFQQRRWLVVEYLCFYSCLRFLLEFLRGDVIRGVWQIGLSSSQIISLVFCLVLATLSLLSRSSLSRC